MENADNRIVIPSDMTKIVLAMVGVIIFTCVGVWLVSIGRVPVLSVIIAIPGFLFLDVACFVIFCGIIRCMLLGKTPGLIIDDSGITNITIFSLTWFVPWEDIVDIKVFSGTKSALIVIIVNNLKNYLPKHKNPIIRQFAIMNYNMTDSSVTISTTTLKCKHNVLENILSEQFMKRKNGVEVAREF